MKVIRRFDVLSVMKLAGVIYGVIGLILGFFFAIAAVFGLFASQGQAGQPFSGPTGVVVAIVFAVIFPVAYGIMGALAAGLMSAIYNITSKRFGGIRVDVDDAPAESAVALPTSN
jgi:hypothetical protein